MQLRVCWYSASAFMGAVERCVSTMLVHSFMSAVEGCVGTMLCSAFMGAVEGVHC